MLITTVINGSKRYLWWSGPCFVVKYDVSLVTGDRKLRNVNNKRTPCKSRLAFFHELLD